MNFPLRIAFPVSHNFGLLCSHFPLFQGIFWFLPWCDYWLTDYLVTCYLASMSLCVFQCSSCGWSLVSFTALWSEKMFDVISIILNLLSFVLCPNLWCILQNTPCALEKYVYSAVLGWNVLKISIKSISSSAQVANARPTDWIWPSTVFYLAQHLVSTLQQHQALA